MMRHDAGRSRTVECSANPSTNMNRLMEPVAARRQQFEQAGQHRVGFPIQQCGKHARGRDSRRRRPAA